MRHRQLTIARLRLDRREVTLAHASLVVVERDEMPRADWEVVALRIPQAIEPPGDLPVPNARVDVEVDAIAGIHADGRLIISRLTGSAVLVRHVDATLVLRGDSALDGLGDFDGPGDLDQAG